MAAVPVPALLDRVARAGAAGLEAPPGPEGDLLVALARSGRIPAAFREGRLYVEPTPDALVPAWIVEETRLEVFPRLEVAGYVELGSTNDEALARARAGARHGLLVYAESQTAGRGRSGRAWVSPPAHGLYLTLVVAPRQPLARWPLLAHAASAALARAVEQLPEILFLERRPRIELKWPNDLLVDGKKCAGILLETATADARVVAAAIGVGVNVGASPPAVASRTDVTSLGVAAGRPVARRRLLTAFLREFQLLYDLFERGEHEALLDAWRARSTMWDGAAITIQDAGGSRDAVTCGLTELGALRIRSAGRPLETLMAGDVTVRWAGPGTGAETPPKDG